VLQREEPRAPRSAPVGTREVESEAPWSRGVVPEIAGGKKGPRYVSRVESVLSREKITRRARLKGATEKEDKEEEGASSRTQFDVYDVRSLRVKLVDGILSLEIGNWRAREELDILIGVIDVPTRIAANVQFGGHFVRAKVRLSASRG